MKKVYAILFVICLTLGFPTTVVHAEEVVSNSTIQETKEIVSEAINIDLRPITKNYNKELKITPTYIVIHETGNRNAGADADAHYIYWNKDEEAKRSTHYVVDENKIVQMLELDAWAWHVGDNKGHSDIKNSNSIGIEICVNEDGDYEAARQRTIRLVKYLMRTLNIDADHVVRHYDASGKFCPETMLRYPELWDDFKASIQNPDLIMDDLIPNIILNKEECHLVNYQTGNTILENKITFKRFNVKNFDYYMIKNYATKNFGFDFTLENEYLYELLNSWFSKKGLSIIDNNLFSKPISNIREIRETA